MSVYFRTGQNTGASVPWWFYLVMTGRFARDQWRQHRP